MAIGTRLTTAGAVLIAKALNGKELTFTRGAYGDAIQDGQMINPTNAQQSALTKLINERMSLPISDYTLKENGDMVVSVSVKNATVASEFKISEVGLFAKDPDSGQELLYGYAFDADGGKMYAKNSAIALEYTVDLVTTIGNAQNVTAVINVDDNLRAGDGLTRRGDTVSAVVANATRLGSVKVGEGLHMNQDSITANTASETVLGSIKVGKGLYMNKDSLCTDAGETTLLEGRLIQLEINQSNLYMKLEAENALGGYANLLLVEDFIDKDCIDQTAIPINYLMTTNSHLKFKGDIEGLETGSDYTVVFGGVNEPLKITGILRYQSNGGYWQLQPAPSKAFLDSTNTIVYRSTATIKDNVAYGPGTMKTRVKNLARKWMGEGMTTPEEIVFETSSDNASKFILDDDWAFTSNGYFTLG